MYQYDSKSKMQSEKSKENTPETSKNHSQIETKIPIQTKSLFSPSFDQEIDGDGEKSNSNQVFRPIHLISLSSSPLQMQLMPKREIQPLPIRMSESQENLLPIPTKPNNTGIPLQMRERFENLSGFSFDDVKVHYNSDKPAQLQALAYTQGNQVYVGSGQEKHLAHELGHVVQQKQGRVTSDFWINGIGINKNVELEREADKLSAVSTLQQIRLNSIKDINRITPTGENCIQRKLILNLASGTHIPNLEVGKETDDFVVNSDRGDMLCMEIVLSHPERFYKALFEICPGEMRERLRKNGRVISKITDGTTVPSSSDNPSASEYIKAFYEELANWFLYTHLAGNIDGFQRFIHDTGGSAIYIELLDRELELLSDPSHFFIFSDIKKEMPFGKNVYDEIHLRSAFGILLIGDIKDKLHGFLIMGGLLIVSGNFPCLKSNGVITSKPSTVGECPPANELTGFQAEQPRIINSGGSLHTVKTAFSESDVFYEYTYRKK